MWRRCARRTTARGGRPGIPPGVCFRMVFIGYFEGIDSQRGIGPGGRPPWAEPLWPCASTVAQANLVQMGSRAEVKELVADKGCHDNRLIAQCAAWQVRTYIPERSFAHVCETGGGRRSWLAGHGQRLQGPRPAPRRAQPRAAPPQMLRPGQAPRRGRPFCSPFPPVGLGNRPGSPLFSRTQSPPAHRHVLFHSPPYLAPSPPPVTCCQEKHPFFDGLLAGSQELHPIHNAPASGVFQDRDLGRA